MPSAAGAAEDPIRSVQNSLTPVDQDVGGAAAKGDVGEAAADDARDRGWQPVGERGHRSTAGVDALDPARGGVGDVEVAAGSDRAAGAADVVGAGTVDNGGELGHPVRSRGCASATVPPVRATTAVRETAAASFRDPCCCCWNMTIS